MKPYFGERLTGKMLDYLMIIKQKPKNKYLNRFLVYLLLTFLIFGILICVLSGCKSKTVNNEDYGLLLRIRADNNINYVIELNNTEIKSGIMEKSWNDLKLNHLSGTYRIYYWNDDYYTDIAEFTEYDSAFNKTITAELTLKESNRKGNLSINIDNGLESGKKQDITLILSANNGTVKKISYCIFRTIGIISARPKENIAYCGNSWTNTTEYGNLTGNNYFCDDLIAQCSLVRGNICIPEDIYLDAIADECYFFGKTLKNEEYNISLDVNTMEYFDDSDYLFITVSDMDLSHDSRILGTIWGYAYDKQFIQKIA